MNIDKLHYISQETDTLSHIQVIQQACEAGCRWIQLRMKEKSETEMQQIASQAKAICQKYSAKLIINDHVHLAKEVAAGGVHLGQTDMPPSEARLILGPDFIIGGTANTFTDIVWLIESEINYVGLGPFRFTSTKKNLSPVLGLEAYREIILKCRQSKIYTPIIAIGGILLEDVDELKQTGIHGIAVSGLITHSQNRKELVEKLYQIL
ncbi:MAG: thiamine phosphate synthase [Microscillaceae bacterium]|nr:thiamine phosphate synthase [Microscillaceae bacterium]